MRCYTQILIAQNSPSNIQSRLECDIYLTVKNIYSRPYSILRFGLSTAFTFVSFAINNNNR